MTAPNPNEGREVQIKILAKDDENGTTLSVDVMHRSGRAPSPFEVLGLLEMAKLWQLESAHDVATDKAVAS
jgi:hypothetical protein